MRDPERLKTSDVVEGKPYALLAYLSILCIIPLILKKENPFVLAHSKQGVVLFVCEVGVFVLSIILPWIWGLGIFLLGVLSFIGIISVLKGKYIELPVISNIADNITL